MGGRKLITNITNCHYLPQRHTNTVCKIKSFIIRPAFTFNDWLGLRWDLISSKKKLLNASQVSSLQSNDHFQLKSKSYVIVCLPIIATYLPNGVSLYPRQWQAGTYVLLYLVLRLGNLVSDLVSRPNISLCQARCCT